MTDPASPLIAYPPIKCIIKQEIPGSQQETSSVEEENWLHQLPKDPVEMADLPLIAYLPINRTIKLEIADENQEVNDVVEENWTLQLNNGSVQTTGITSSNASLVYEASGKSKDVLRAPHHPSRRDRQTAMNALEEEEAQQETKVMEKFGSDEEGFEYDQQSERSEHSSLEDFDESYIVIAPASTDDKDSIAVPKAGPSKEPKRQVRKSSHRKQRGSNDTAPMQKRPFKCTKCDSSYRQKRYLDQHMKKECVVTFQCTLCKQNFTVKSSLRTHLLKVHNIDHHKLEKYGAGYMVRPINPYKCHQCGLSYKNKRYLVSHLKIACGGAEPSFFCPKCDRRCKRKANLKLHLIEVHQVERSQLAAFGLGPVVRPENEFKCDRCGTSYKHKKHLKRHSLVTKCGKY